MCRIKRKKRCEIDCVLVIYEDFCNLKLKCKLVLIVGFNL